MLWLVLVLCCFVLAWRSRGHRGGASELPSYPGRLPIIGHTHLFWNRKTMFSSLQKMTKYAIEQMHCEPFIVYFGPFKKYFFSDLDDCVFLSNTCLKKNYTFVERLIEKGLLTSDVETWKRDRKLLNPAFSFTVLDEYVTVFNSKAKQFASDMASQVGRGPFKPDEYVADFVLKTTCHTTVNFKTDDIISNKYKRTFDELLEIYVERFQKFWLHKKFVYAFTPLHKKEIALTQVIADITKKAILKRRSELLQNNNKTAEERNDNLDDNNKPLLDLLLQLELKRNAFSDEALLHHLTTGIIATYDTTSKAIKFLLLLIGSYKHVQDRIYEELQEVFGDTERDVDKQDLSKLVYLEAVIKETLRLYPVTAYVARISETEVKLKKYTIPPKSYIVLLLYALNRHPIWGADAQEYRPERWLEPGGVPDNPHALTIFGIGKRHCIGKRYAMMMMKVTLVHFLRRYRVAGDVSKLQVNLDIMVTPTSGHEITIESRKNTHN